jgi:hypothetical protein
LWTSGRPTEIWVWPWRWISAEGVDALAHHVDRPLDRVAGDGALLGARLALVDKLDAALEVEAEDRLLRRDRGA